MFELPLFPLNTVLFPGMPLHLHIFEERYKKMVRLCLDRGVPFGVALIKQGAEAFGPPAETHPVGCTARILEVEPLAEGRMNLVAVGQERFRTLLTDRKRAPYLTGIVEALPLVDGDEAALENAGQRLKPWLKRYLEMLAASGGIQMQAADMPDEPHTLAYLAAISLQVPNAEKQEFLAIEETSELLGRLYKAYQREVALLQAMMNRAKPGEIEGFSLN
jgi:Lon protease-like protein